MTEVGSRVGAVMSADAKEVKFFGYGVYVGDEVPGEEVGGFNLGFPNPKIELDSGKVVFGCECWWGSEEEVVKMIGERVILDINIDEERKRKE